MFIHLLTFIRGILVLFEIKLLLVLVADKEQHDQICRQDSWEKKSQTAD